MPESDVVNPGHESEKNNLARASESKSKHDPGETERFR
jgi:hypothetical protein